MKKVLVVNDSLKDIFSEYLLGAGCQVDRQTSTAVLQKGADDAIASAEVILVVNRPLVEAVKIKSQYSAKRVVLASGGAKDFQPYLVVVHYDQNHDYYNYRDWSDFQQKVLFEQARPEKWLNFYRPSQKGNFYRPSPLTLADAPQSIKPDFAEFITIINELSQSYLGWLSRWADDVEKFSFPTPAANSSRKNKLSKKIKRTTVVLDNNYRGLPIFKESDPVIFSGPEAQGFAIAEVIQVNDDEMVVSFDSPITRRQLSTYSEFRPHARALHLKIVRWTTCLDTFKFYVDQRELFADTQATRPLDVLAGATNTNFQAVVPEVVFLSPSAEKILRDVSQSRALVDILSRKFINLVIGPAGTGKTFLTALVIEQCIRLAQKGRVILITSHSNLGVDNLVLEIAKHLDPRKIFRLGNNEAVISPAVRPFHCVARQAAGFFGKTDQSPREAENNHLHNLLEQGGQCVLACTLDSYLTLFQEKKYQLPIDIVVIDEASRGLPFEFLPPISAAQEKVILIGDNRQLGNISLPREVLEFLQAQAAKKRLTWPAVELFNKGFFNSLIEYGYFSANLLDHNRRSLNLISQLVSQAFYQGRLIPSRFNPYNAGQLIFWDTSRNDNFQEKRVGTSYCNPKEAAYLVQQFIRRAAKHLTGGGQITDLAIITPYMAQVRLIRRLLRKHLLYHQSIKDQVNAKNIDDILEQLVITVDAIQGGQRPIIFISLVRSNQRGDIGFNNDIRRINVAISRAQNTLVIIGNASSFLECGYPSIQACFREIIASVRKCGGYKKVV